MDTLKKIFPMSWKFTADVSNFVVGIIIYIVLCVPVGIVLGLAKIIVEWIPLVGNVLVWALGVIGGLVGLYALIGLFLLILVYCKVIKD